MNVHVTNADSAEIVNGCGGGGGEDVKKDLAEALPLAESILQIINSGELTDDEQAAVKVLADMLHTKLLEAQMAADRAA